MRWWRRRRFSIWVVRFVHAGDVTKRFALVKNSQGDLEQLSLVCTRTRRMPHVSFGQVFQHAHAVDAHF